MKNLITHLLQTNMEEIVKSSYINCHVHGLHSIMIVDKPGSRVRMYVAESGCALKDCTPDKIKFGGKLPLGFHAHHCALTFEIVKGVLNNWIVFPSSFGGNYKGFNSYRFKSPILEETGGFDLVGKDLFMITDKVERLYEGHITRMEADQIHTVSIDETKITSWIVYEGKENPDFQNLTFSNIDLLNGHFEGLYIKPDADDIMRIIKMSGILEYTSGLRKSIA